MSLHFDLNTDSKQSLCETLWLMMTRHHAKLGHKGSNSSEDRVQILNEILKLCCDIDCELGKAILSQDTLAYIVLNKVW